jgi:N-acetyl-alpha-D-glucosaminyl L-malate synthase BshA
MSAGASLKIGITCYPTYGGSGVVATELGMELARRGHEVHFISYAPPIRLNESLPNIHFHEVSVSRYELFEYPPYDLALASRMAEIAEIYELDLLHVHYAIPHSVSALLARQMLCCDHVRQRRRLPFVTTLHGTDITLVGLDHSLLPITRYSIEHSDGVTSISEYLRQQTVEQFSIQRPIEVIPNFVNCSLYKRSATPSPHRSEFAAGNERIIMHLSNFRPVKRVCDVIEVFDRIQRKIPAKLLMVGDGPERSRAEWLAVDKGLHGKVLFLGKQDNIHEKLQLADLLLMPSAQESFGLAALEAMACEVVPVATRVGGVPEVIEHGATGFMAPVGAIEEMADCAIGILEDETKLRAMGHAAREFARKNYCASRIIPRYEEYYRSVLKGSA